MWNLGQCRYIFTHWHTSLMSVEENIFPNALSIQFQLIFQINDRCVSDQHSFQWWITSARGKKWIYLVESILAMFQIRSSILQYSLATDKCLAVGSSTLPNKCHHKIRQKMVHMYLIMAQKNRNKYLIITAILQIHSLTLSVHLIWLYTGKETKTDGRWSFIRDKCWWVESRISSAAYCFTL